MEPSEKADIEYQLLHEQELDELLENSKLPEEGKNAVRAAAKHIITAQALLESSPVSSKELEKYLEDTKAEFQKLKDRLI